VAGPTEVVQRDKRIEVGIEDLPAGAYEYSAYQLPSRPSGSDADRRPAVEQAGERQRELEVLGRVAVAAFVYASIAVACDRWPLAHGGCCRRTGTVFHRGAPRGEIRRRISSRIASAWWCLARLWCSSAR
jgi:hypothetical protein